MSELPEFVRKYIDEIARVEGFSKYTTEVDAGSKHGDNFMSDMLQVVLKGARERNGEVIHDNLNLICKVAPSNAERRREFQSIAVFKREGYLYSQVLPAFVEFQKERGLSEKDGFFAFPKCYKVVADEEADHFVIIMENLKTMGFKMWPKEKSLAIEQMKLIMRELAKLHAISFAFEDQKPDIFKKFKKLDDILIGFFAEDINISAVYPRTYQRVIDALKDERCKNAMIEFKRDFRQIIAECVGVGVCEPFGVITHGDPWIANLLFQYNDEVSEAPVDAVTQNQKHK